MPSLCGLYFSLLALLSLAGFCAMGADKRRARRGLRRLSERSLFALALCLGAVGATAGMFFFRHKTKHWYFRFFFPLLAVLQLALGALLALRGL